MIQNSSSFAEKDFLRFNPNHKPILDLNNNFIMNELKSFIRKIPVHRHSLVKKHCLFKPQRLEA